MKKEARFSYLQGFCPVDKLDDITTLSKSTGFGYLIEEPTDTDDVPTLVRNPKWIRIIQPVFQFMNTVPGYKEFDISPWFLMFFSLFFAMLIGDAGYGCVFAVITFLAQRKFKKIPREPFILLYVLSFATTIWGILTGTWFGTSHTAYINTSTNSMIYFCFIIGAVQLTLAHLITAFKRINSFQSLSDLGWILTIWGLFFIAGKLVAARPFPDFARYILIAGVALIFLFTKDRANIPLKVIGSFADVVSYIRLFAVGYASLILARTFNTMALELGFNSILTGFIAAFILFTGHALNITLGLMAVIVHGIRLNMLEFSGQMGMEWSGKEYKPFKEEAIP